MQLNKFIDLHAEYIDLRGKYIYLRGISTQKINTSINMNKYL